MNKKIAFIMINYKNYADRFLKESYESLQKINYPKDCYRLYIVDNATSPETRARIKKLAPEAIVIPSDGNGWGHANNVGARQAIQEGFADYFYLVNMDTKFDQACLNEAMKAMDSDGKIGAVQSKLLLYSPVNGEYLLNSKGNSLTFLGFSYCAGGGKRDDTPDKITDIVTASGVGILIRKDVFLEIGMCDESYFMYHDDIELSFKTKILGYRVVLAPRSVIYHKHEFSRAVRQTFFMERNRLRFMLEFFKWPTLIIIFPAFIIMEIGMLPYAALNGWLLIKLKAYAYFLKPSNLRRVFLKRKGIKQLRKISDKEMLRGVVGVIDFQQITNPVLKYIANPIFNLYWQIIRRLIIW